VTSLAQLEKPYLYRVHATLEALGKLFNCQTRVKAPLQRHIFLGGPNSSRPLTPFDRLPQRAAPLVTGGHEPTWIMSPKKADAHQAGHDCNSRPLMSSSNLRERHVRQPNVAQQLILSRSPSQTGFARSDPRSGRLTLKPPECLRSREQGADYTRFDVRTPL